ncbi:ribonuclease III [Fibrobacterota bacterium]
MIHNLFKLASLSFLRKSSLTGLEARIKYRFKRSSFLKLALSHRSYVHANQLNEVRQSNERLEFLGDAVLDLIITEYLYQQYPREREGVLSKMKSLIVSAQVLALCARKWNLGKYILLSNSEKRSGGKGRVSILADTYEAVLGAVYLDGGLDQARDLIHGSVIPVIDEALADEELVNYKSTLLEYTQSKGMGAPVYRVLKEKGPEHHKIFKVGVYVREQEWGRGEGYSKKAAEQSAGRMALESYAAEKMGNE